MPIVDVDDLMRNYKIELSARSDLAVLHSELISLAIRRQ